MEHAGHAGGQGIGGFVAVGRHGVVVCAAMQGIPAGALGARQLPEPVLGLRFRLY